MRPVRVILRRLLCGLAVAVVVSALSGCSALQVGYNNADTLLQWRAWQYFDFQDEQKTAFESRVQRFLGWHRRTALPQYARIAHEMSERLSRGLSQADLVWGYDAFQGQLRAALREGASEMGGLLDELTEAQVERFEARLEKENRDRAREAGMGESPETQHKLRIARNVERLEGWFGALTEAQLALVRDYSERAPLDAGLRERDRRRLQRELLGLVRAKQARAKLASWAEAWDRNREPAYASAARENVQEYFRMVLNLDKTLTAEQRQRAVMRLRDFAGDATSLAALGAGAR